MPAFNLPLQLATRGSVLPPNPGKKFQSDFGCAFVHGEPGVLSILIRPKEGPTLNFRLQRPGVLETEPKDLHASFSFSDRNTELLGQEMDLFHPPPAERRPSAAGFGASSGHRSNAVISRSNRWICSVILAKPSERCVSESNFFLTAIGETRWRFQMRTAEIFRKGTSLGVPLMKTTLTCFRTVVV